jgi:uncharacterized protein (DUF1330 family)
MFYEGVRVSSFIVFTTEPAVSDDNVDAYRRRVDPTTDAFSGTVRSVSTGTNGAQPRILILEFPGLKDAKDWYDSPGFQTIRDRRFRGIIYSQRAFQASGGGSSAAPFA